MKSKCKKGRNILSKKNEYASETINKDPSLKIQTLGMNEARLWTIREKSLKSRRILHLECSVLNFSF